MYSIYLQVCQALGYEIVFNQFEIESNNLELDELVGFMANIDELDSNEVILAECDLIDRVIESLGYEI